ncbi:DNA gyrase subunit A [Candidatus Dependentiae bacterium]|nr:DNA gyrase subunit A [Candidatus Dependentiae bacterium]
MPDQNSSFEPSVKPLSIEKELKTSFLDYAMSVIVSRALPDVRDGLKPVHRRILYAMHKLGYYHDRSYRKSATVVGEVIGHYHPHGDSPIYQSMVGLVQEFSKRYPLLDGQGNWGSIDGDNAAAMRYTECRMAKIAKDILADIEKQTVQFVPNFDESTKEPTLLPSRIPNFLVNGSTGIAVGMATSVPPHNLSEVVTACIKMITNPKITDEEIFNLIPAPDFPTGGIICGRSGILKAYRTGHGSVTLRGVVDIDENKKQNRLIICEIPYQVNKADLITKIANLVKNKVIDGISNIRDESNKKGIRVVIDLKRGEIPSVVLNQLYKHTPLQSKMSILLLALYQNRPMIFTLREVLDHFIVHRKEIVTRRTEFDLAKHEARAHICHGLLIALENIDRVVELVKKSDSAVTAIEELQVIFKLSELQSKAILEMKLQRLTGLEQTKLRDELKMHQEFITQLKLILDNPSILNKEIIKEFEEIQSSYGDKRKSRIEGAIDSFEDKDLIPDEEAVVTLTRKGYIKRVPLDTYTVQHRGGRGKKGMADLAGSEDIMQDVFVAKTHDELLFFTNLGRVYNLDVFQVPEGSRTSKGRAIINLLPLAENEKVVKLLCLREMENKFLVMITKHGIIKKTDMSSFAKIRSTGIRAVGLKDDDELAFCDVSHGNNTIVIATSLGQGIRFNEEEVRAMGRQAAGVRGIKLRAKDFVVGMEIIAGDEKDLLFATSRGYGKRVRIEDFRIAHRGGLGVRTIPVDNRNGEVIGLVLVSQESNILLIDTNGKIIRLSPQEIRTMRRHAKGVRLIKLDKSQTLATVVAFEEEENDDGNEPGPSGGKEPRENLTSAKPAQTVSKNQRAAGETEKIEEPEEVEEDEEIKEVEEEMMMQAAVKISTENNQIRAEETLEEAFDIDPEELEPKDTVQRTLF